MIIIRRPRRNRISGAVRALAQETTLSIQDFIFPMFVQEGNNQVWEIASMPGIYRYSPDKLLFEIEACMQIGIQAICLFPNIEENKKDRLGSEGFNPEGLYPTTIRQVKARFPELCLMTDVALDPYSTDGHDGIVENGKILNDETLEILGKMALVQAQAGADLIGPSDMMDGRVGSIRSTLDKHGFTDVGIISYTAKYASAFYGPFRDALQSAPKFGDKKTYQMNPANAREALIEAELDYAEGADFLMVKPALAYLDIIQLLSQRYNIPIAAYNVSGEYAMIKAAAKLGWLDSQKCMWESLLSIKRAGAKVILSYFAKEVAQILHSV